MQQCRRRFRFGHTDRLCRSSASNALCSRYASDKHCFTECINVTAKCINYIQVKLTQQNYTADSDSCPLRMKEKKKKEIMSTLCLSNRELEEYIKNYGYDLPKSYKQEKVSFTFGDFLPPSYAEYTKNTRSKGNFESPLVNNSETVLHSGLLGGVRSNTPSTIK